MKKERRAQLPRIIFQRCELVEITDPAEQAELDRRCREAEKILAARERAAKPKRRQKR